MDPLVPPKNTSQNPVAPAATPAPASISRPKTEGVSSNPTPQVGQIDWSYRPGSRPTDASPSGPLTLEEAVKSQLGGIALKPVIKSGLGPTVPSSTPTQNTSASKTAPEKVEQIHTLQGDMKHAEKSNPTSSATIISNLEGLGPIPGKAQTKFVIPPPPKAPAPSTPPAPAPHIAPPPTPKPPSQEPVAQKPPPLSIQTKPVVKAIIPPPQPEVIASPRPAIAPRPASLQTAIFRPKTDAPKIVPPPLKTLNEEEELPHVKWTAPTIAPSSRPIPAPEIAPKKKISVIQTFTGDISEAVKSQGTSVASIAIAESQRKKRVSSDAGTGIITALIVILSIVLISGGGGLVVYLLVPDKVPASVGQPPTAVIIRADSKKEIILNKNSRDGFTSLLKTEVNRGVPYATIEEVVMSETETTDTGTTKRPATSLEFFSFINANLSPTLERAFAPGLMLGLHTFEGTHPFLIVRLSSYDNAYAGMLKWERNITTDLSDIFGFTRGVVEINNGTFVDGIVKNIDVRFLKNPDGSIKLLYGFVDNKTLVITNSDLTLIEISQRLRTAALIK